MHKLLSECRVLVIEDEMLILMMIEMMLGDLDCQSVVSASTLGTALAAVEREDFDIAMLDMNLGGEESSSIADALDVRGVPYLFCTGNVGGDRRADVKTRAVLRKPFTFRALSEELGALVKERNLPQAAA
jgi:CheY-like chemotaxis protein